uniref:Uncharacterized protein n=1 Tax=Anguilla anguilla TaxID=7936 RepID=A0A0E9PV15_ANGAN
MLYILCFKYCLDFMMISVVMIIFYLKCGQD